MSDIVKKYQHYFNESVRLQEMVNEQAAYIAKLEEALLALSEDLTTDEREEENEKRIKAAKDAANAAKSAADFKSAADLARAEELGRAELDVRDAAGLERDHPTKIFGRGGTVVGTTGSKKANSPFKLGYVANPNYEKGK